jgi:hypothetical protein
MSALGQ